MNKNLINDMLIQEELRRVHPIAVHGDLPDMIQEDLRQWALKNDHQLDDSDNGVSVLHAIDRGWLQANFTGMEIYE